MGIKCCLFRSFGETALSDDDSNYGIDTETSPNQGLFKTTLTIKAASMSTALAGEYKCLFIIDSEETYFSVGDLVVRQVSVNPADAIVSSYTNAELMLTCQLDASDNTTGVTWTGPDGVFEDGTSVQGKDDYILTIANPTDDVNGKYTCSFGFSDGLKPVAEFADVRVSIVALTDSTGQTSPIAIATLSADNLIQTLYCELVSTAQEILVFWSNNQEVDPTRIKYEGGKTLAEYDVPLNSAEAGGEYSCRVSETEYSPTTIVLTVLEMNTELPSFTRGIKNETVTLVCMVGMTAEIATPVITWYITSVNMVETKAIEIPMNVEAEDASTLQSNLTVIVDTANDGAVYRCEAVYTGLVTGTSLDSKTNIVMSR